MRIKKILFNRSAILSNRMHSQMYLYLMLLIAFSLPFHRNFGTVLLILLCLLWIYTRNFTQKWSRLVAFKLPFLFISLYALYLLGLMYSENMSYGISRLERGLPLLLFPIIVFSSEMLGKKELTLILKAYVSGVFLASVVAITYGIYRRFVLNDMDQIEINNFYIDLPHVFMHHIHFGVFLALGLFSLTFLYFQKNDKRVSYRILILFLCLLFFSMLVTMGGFMAFIAVVFIAIFLLLMHPNVDLKLVLPIVFTILAVLSLTFVSYKDNSIVQRYTQRLSLSFSEIENNRYNYSSSRVGPLVTAVDVLKNNWLVGVGTGDTPNVMERQYIQNGLDDLTEFNTHNQYLDFWVSFGLLGILLLILNLFYPLWLSLQRKSYLYLCFLLLISLCLITENLLATNKTIYLYAFLNSVLASYTLNLKEKQ